MEFHLIIQFWWLNPVKKPVFMAKSQLISGPYDSSILSSWLTPSGVNHSLVGQSLSVFGTTLASQTHSLCQDGSDMILWNDIYGCIIYNTDTHTCVDMWIFDDICIYRCVCVCVCVLIRIWSHFRSLRYLDQTKVCWAHPPGKSATPQVVSAHGDLPKGPPKRCKTCGF